MLPLLVGEVSVGSTSQLVKCPRNFWIWSSMSEAHRPRRRGRLDATTMSKDFADGPLDEELKDTGGEARPHNPKTQPCSRAPRTAPQKTESPNNETRADIMPAAINKSPTRSNQILGNLASTPECKWDNGTGTLEVQTPHRLIQAVGYLKYAGNQMGGVYFRGQNKPYPKILPSLYRNGSGSPKGKNKRETALSDFKNQARTKEAILRGTPDYTWEPLLQHYGIRTRWLDLVDNIWTALWFACHTAHPTGNLKEYIHFSPSQEEYGYIILMQTGIERPVEDRPGLWRSDSAEIIDLRRAAPSIFLRPHAQHGILIRRIAYPDVPSVDLSDLVVGRIRVKSEMARSWLGQGEL